MKNIDDVAQKRPDNDGFVCKFLWPNGDGFGVTMNELPKKVYIDSKGKRFWFVQSDNDNQVYLFVAEETII